MPTSKASLIIKFSLSYGQQSFDHITGLAVALEKDGRSVIITLPTGKKISHEFSIDKRRQALTRAYLTKNNEEFSVNILFQSLGIILVKIQQK